MLGMPNSPGVKSFSIPRLVPLSMEYPSEAVTREGLTGVRNLFLVTWVCA